MKKLIRMLLPPASCLLCREIVTIKNLICNDCHPGLPWQNLTEKPVSSFPELNISVSLFRYCSPIDHWISQLKFQDQLIYAQFFGQCFIEYLRKHQTPLPEFLLPVPLHRKRLRERGFNQALEIAKPIAHYFKTPIAKNFVARRKYTKPQSDLSAAQRFGNVKNAFIVNNTLKAKHIAIIDDVVTTGSTVYALAEILKNSGVEKIEIWCVAKTNP